MSFCSRRACNLNPAKARDKHKGPIVAQKGRLTALVVGIRQNVEHITEHGQKVLLEEGVCNGGVLLGEVADKLDGDYDERLSAPVRQAM